MAISDKIKEWNISLLHAIILQAKAKEGATSLTWVISQEDHVVEITHFEGTGLNGLCPNKFFIPNKG